MQDTMVLLALLLLCLALAAADLRDRYHRGRMLTSNPGGFVVYDVITDHITKEDLKFKRVG